MTSSHRVDDFDNIRFMLVVGDNIPTTLQAMCSDQRWVLKRLDGMHPRNEILGLRAWLRESARYKVVVLTNSVYIVNELSIGIMLNALNPEKGYDPKKLAVIDATSQHDHEWKRVEIGRHGFRIESIDAIINEQSVAFQDVFFALDARDGSTSEVAGVKKERIES